MGTATVLALATAGVVGTAVANADQHVIGAEVKSAAHGPFCGQKGSASTLRGPRALLRNTRQTQGRTTSSSMCRYLKTSSLSISAAGCSCR